MKFDNKLKKLREENNLSLQQLADKIGSTKSVIWHYENKGSTPSAETLKKLALYFNVTIDYLLFDDSEKKDITIISDNKFMKKINEILKMDPKYKNFIENAIDIVLEKNKKND
jgi:transcriptional regulator with XRE-family HTH domain